MQYREPSHSVKLAARNEAFGTPSSSFCAIFAIEIASFLMTLVRKGIIEARCFIATATVVWL